MESGNIGPAGACHSPGKGKDGTAEPSADQLGQGMVHASFNEDFRGISRLAESCVNQCPQPGNIRAKVSDWKAESSAVGSRFPSAGNAAASGLRLGTPRTSSS